MTCKERFLKYIAVSTASDEDSTESPSTTRQLELSRRLAEEMLSLGLKNVHMDSCGNAIGTLPATEGVKAAGTLALVAHVDTAPAASGEGVNAREVLYTGEDIELGHGVILSEKQFPAMKDVRGQVLLVTDGSTLLGADDKAGVAEIMTAVEKLIASGAPHGELRIVFTTDEEVGRGTEGLDVKELACDWGYTVDGGELGVYEYENFNAAAALVRVHGVGIHPGSAKNIMKNAATIATELHSLLPADQVPEKTEGYEGFIHLTDMSGDVVEAELHYIIRDHDRAKFEDRKAVMQKVCAEIDRRYGAGTVELTLRDSYYNMKEKIEPCMFLIENAKRAMEQLGIEPKVVPIRGGTDGARLSFEGLPCPNLCTGGENFHGRFEYIPAEDMERITQLLAVMLWNLAE
ncbi:MAG TPA: peptidase T [Clostridiales bacterium]|nr:peptidase T [Clostridiales bacterium]